MACLILVLSLVVGFGLDAKGFGGNVLAELAGVLVGTAVAILVVERLLDQDRRARWRLVETETIKTLRFALVKAALPLYLHLPAPRPPRADPFTIEDLGEALQNLSGALSGEQPSDFRSPPLRQVLDGVAPHIHFMRDSIMPRLLTVNPNPELIKRLALLESTYEDLDLDAWLEDRFGSREGETTYRLSQMADSLREVVLYLDANWKVQPRSG